MMKKVPKRRFKGFLNAGDWEQRKLGDIATITGGGTPSTNISEYWNGDIDWYSPVEIGEKRYASGSIRKITKLGLEKSSAKILPVGTVLFTSRAGIGNTAILQVEGCTNQGFQSITPNSKELDTYFLYTMTPKLKRYGEVTGAGSTFVEVSSKQMEQMNLMIPSLDEQKHVSQLFKVMDDATTLHQRKLEKLQATKKALLYELFPIENSRRPKRRFKGFTGDWEQRKFKNFVQIRRGLTYRPSDIASSGIRVLRSSNINEDQFITGTNDVFVNIDAVDIPYVKNGDILLTSANGSAHLVGKHAIINNIVENSAVHGGFMLLVESKNPQFINALLGSNWYKKFINLYVSGGNGAIGNLSKSDLEEQDVMLPSEEEQKAIGRVYFYMNHLITLHQRKLEKLKNLKAAYLNEMFV